MEEATEFHEAMTLMGSLMRRAEALDEETLDTEELARWVWSVRGAIKRLRVIDGEASTALAERLDRGVPTLIDGVVWEASTTSTRKEWNNDAVRREVMLAARFDPTTGEARTTDEALAIMSKLYPLGGSGLRVTAAKDLLPGFDPDEFCHTERRSTVRATEAARPKAATA